jgi:flagellar biogenesis protein FliO
MIQNISNLWEPIPIAALGSLILSVIPILVFILIVAWILSQVRHGPAGPRDFNQR